MIRKLTAGVAVAALTLGFASAASATIVLNLGVPNSDISPYPAPYGTVSITRNTSTTASIVFNAVNTGGFNYFFIANDVAGVNVNASSFSFSGLTGNGGTLSDGGSGNVDGHGVFNQTFDQFDGYANRGTTLSFNLTNLSGTWATDADVLTPNGSGFVAAAHIAVCDTSTNPTCASDPGAVKTGYAANGGGGGAIPEPATWTMMILGFGGVGAMMRRRRVSLIRA